jgi:hypothetical protein
LGPGVVFKGGIKTGKHCRFLCVITDEFQTWDINQ